jgi:hypothetical protein
MSRLEQAVRSAWVEKIKRELDQILSAMIDPNDVNMRAQVVEWVQRSLKAVPVAEKDIKNTPLYKIAIFLSHSDVTSFQILWEKMKPFLPANASTTYFKRILTKFDWNLPFEIPETKSYQRQPEPVVKKLVNKGEKPVTLNDVILRLGSMDSDIKAVVDLIEDLSKRIAKVECELIMVTNKTDDMVNSLEPEQDDIERMDLQLKSLANSMTDVKLALSVLSRHEHSNGKIMVPYEA